MGQNVPFSKAIFLHTLNQSALLINPSRGVKPPIPNIITSPNSLEEHVTLVRVSDFFISSKASLPSIASGISLLFPWGGTIFNIDFLIHFYNSQTHIYELMLCYHRFNYYKITIKICIKF